MKMTEKTFQVLDILDNQEISTQRQIADHSGISLGQVNYILKSLLEKGMVKVGNFKRNPHKIGYAYLLTPRGIETKSRLAVKFISLKLNEYNNLRKRLVDRLVSIEKKGNRRIIFVGPLIIKEFVESTIEEFKVQLTVVKHCEDWKELRELDTNVFDAVLLMDGNSDNRREIEDSLGIPGHKLYCLW